MIDATRISDAMDAVNADLDRGDWGQICADYGISAEDTLVAAVGANEGTREGSFLTGLLLGLKLGKSDPR